MSGISGSCSQPVSRQLFEQGLEIQQAQKLQSEQKIQMEQTNSPSGVSLIETLKGINIDEYV